MSRRPPQPIANLFIRSTIVQETRDQVKSAAAKCLEAKRFASNGILVPKAFAGRWRPLQSKNEPQKMRVGKFGLPSLSHDHQLQGRDDKQALVTGAKTDDHVCWR